MYKINKFYNYILIILIICCIYIFYISHNNESFKSDNLSILISKNNWLKSCRNLKYSENYLEVELEDDWGNWIYNKIEIHPLLINKKFINTNGFLKYDLTKEESDYIMTKLFPIYKGKTIPIIYIDECIMLSVDVEKYNKIRNETIQILNKYKIPNIKIFYGYTPSTVSQSKYYNLMKYKNQRNELALGMLEIFDIFVNKYKNLNINTWLLYFEDDVRPINIEKKEDLTVLYNIPVDAELIRPYIGKNEKINIRNMSYKLSYGGGLNHAFYISVSGCKKVINYANKFSWKYVCDIDLYKIAKGCGGFPTAYDSWNLSSVDGVNNITPLLREDEKINMYSMSNCIFDQTSLPLEHI